MFKSKSVMMSCLACLVGGACLNFWVGYLPNTFKNDFDIGENIFGYFLLLQTFTYIFSCFVMPMTCEILPRRFLFMVGILGFAVSMVLLGPSLILDLPYNKFLVIASFPLLGIMECVVILPVVPEIYERMIYEHNVKLGENEVRDSLLNDKCNDAFGCVYALSLFVGPNIGGAMKEALEHRTTCDVWILINLVTFVILFIFNGDYRVFSENRVFQEKIEELMENQEEDAAKNKVSKLFYSSNKISVVMQGRRHWYQTQSLADRNFEAVKIAKASILVQSRHARSYIKDSSSQFTSGGTSDN